MAGCLHPPAPAQMGQFHLSEAEALSLMLISNELPGCSKLLSHACLKNSMLMGAVGEVEEAEGRY